MTKTSERPISIPISCHVLRAHTWQAARRRCALVIIVRTMRCACTRVTSMNHSCAVRTYTRRQTKRARCTQSCRCVCVWSTLAQNCVRNKNISTRVCLRRRRRPINVVKRVFTTFTTVTMRTTHPILALVCVLLEVTLQFGPLVEHKQLDQLVGSLELAPISLTFRVA